MPAEGVNSISILGRDLLLVDVGGGVETHLAATDDPPTARAALAEGRLESSCAAVTVGYDEAALTAQRWAPSTLCGRVWWEMAAGKGGTFRPWQEVSLAPTCRSCLRVIDTWFTATETPGGVELLASVVADTVETYGSAQAEVREADDADATPRESILPSPHGCAADLHQFSCGHVLVRRSEAWNRTEYSRWTSSG